MLTALSPDLTNVLPFARPVDAVCHVQAYEAAPTSLPFVTSPEPRAMLTVEGIGGAQAENGEENPSDDACSKVHRGRVSSN